MLVSIDVKSRTLPVLLATRAFSVNFLKEGRGDICRLFASKASDKFHSIVWKPGANGMPVLHDDIVAHAECVVVQEVEAGDHVILIGAVTGGAVADPRVKPLLYYRRTYGAADVSSTRNLGGAASRS